jgi:hypothetical protein
LLSSKVWATPYYDNTINWPGYEYLGYSQDRIGEPDIFLYAADVTTDSSSNLQSVVMHMSGRQGIVDYWIGGENGAVSWDALFINTGYTTGSTYESWNYYVEDINGDNLSGATLYSVASGYTYKYATQPYTGLNGRWGHPAGIADGITADTSGLLVGVVWDGTANTLTYTFSPGIVLGDNYVIGYTEWCANDVFLTPVPEPAALLLLGLGLVGVGLVKRRMK